MRGDVRILLDFVLRIVIHILYTNSMALAKLYSNTETIIVLCQYVFEIVTMLLGVPPLWWVELAPKMVFGKKMRLDMIGKRFANFC